MAASALNVGMFTLPTVSTVWLSFGFGNALFATYLRSHRFVGLRRKGSQDSEDEANALNAADAVFFRSARRGGQRTHSVLLPCIKLAGPLPWLQIQPALPSQHHALVVGRRHLGARLFFFICVLYASRIPTSPL